MKLLGDEIIISLIAKLGLELIVAVNAAEHINVMYCQFGSLFPDIDALNLHENKYAAANAI
jgi:hypothetical protein